MAIHKIRQVTSQKTNKTHAWFKKSNIKNSNFTLLFLHSTEYIDGLYLLNINSKSTKFILLFVHWPFNPIVEFYAMV